MQAQDLSSSSTYLCAMKVDNTIYSTNIRNVARNTALVYLMFVCLYVAYDAITSRELFDGIPDAAQRDPLCIRDKLQNNFNERFFNKRISNTPISFESNKIILSVFNYIKTDLFASLRYKIFLFCFHQSCCLKNVEETNG